MRNTRTWSWLVVPCPANRQPGNFSGRRLLPHVPASGAPLAPGLALEGGARELLLAVAVTDDVVVVVAAAPAGGTPPAHPAADALHLRAED